ncbi:TIM barrel protein [uncultured Anaerococcus sp.]|uniref:sugar phosphate isomerase/epimerase family protein n=1 Tax=uncultured Anaerococcus sp. TaxID=293428 RepID=UPI0028898CB6|nr:TIM barrel protein [uncultured Anaerococcus sp.]
MKLGLNLSFAIKRWVEPEILASVIKDELNTSDVQFTWDQVDPWWPDSQRNEFAREYKEAFKTKNIKIHGYFAGSSAYCYPQLLAPLKIQRKIAVEYFKRAIDTAIELGTDIIGSPLGSLSNRDAYDKERRAYIYEETLNNLTEISRYAKEKGIREIHVECTPLETEFPSTPDEANNFIEDINRVSYIPIKLLIDWGHAVFKPLYGEYADMIEWLDKCKNNIGAVHIQQTDGNWDRHWDFTKDGIVTKDKIDKSNAIKELENLYQFLEVVPIYEDKDENVLAGMKKTMEYLNDVFEG